MERLTSFRSRYSWESHGELFRSPRETYENVRGHFVLLPINPKRRPAFCYCAVAIRKLGTVVDE